MTDEFEALSGYAQKNDRIEELERELTVLRTENRHYTDALAVQDVLMRQRDAAREVVEALDPEKMRYIARTLDILSGLLLSLWDSDIELRVNGVPMSEKDRTLLAEWMRGSSQQDDLRAWAEALSHYDEVAG